jgi:peptidoglycan/LPS O-acetylase OafA/YrhL
MCLVVLGLFNLFVVVGKPMKAVPVLFIAAVLLAGILGELVARGYSEPMNRWLRKRWGVESKSLGSVIESDEAPRQEKSPDHGHPCKLSRAVSPQNRTSICCLRLRRVRTED